MLADAYGQRVMKVHPNSGCGGYRQGNDVIFVSMALIWQMMDPLN